MGHTDMSRMVWIIGVAFAFCALAAGSPDPDRWSDAVRAFMIVIAGATVLMNLESDLARQPQRHRAARFAFPRSHPAG